MSDRTKISWSDATWSPVTGCTRVSEGCEHCLDPATLVMTADLRPAPIGSVQVGDELLATDDVLTPGANRRLRISTVEAVTRATRLAIQVALASGREFVASFDHRWLSPHRPAWRTTGNLTIGSELAAVCDPPRRPPREDDYLLGYLAGATDGDGTWRRSLPGVSQMTVQPYWRVAVLSTDQAILDQLCTAAALLGVRLNVQPHATSPNRKPMVKVETRRAENVRRVADLVTSHPRNPSSSWMAGWLAGVIDTDGSHHDSLRVNQRKPNDLLSRCVRYAGALGFTLQPERFPGGSCPSVRFAGDIGERIRFLATVQPVLRRKVLGRIPGTTIAKHHDAVTSLTAVGERNLVDIQTSTGTFVLADGLVTHNCYIDRTPPFRMQHRRFDGTTIGSTTGIRLHPDRLDQPVRWAKPRRIFVCSLADLFHEDVPDAYIARVFAVMALAPHHTFQILTKRHRRLQALLSMPSFGHLVAQQGRRHHIGDGRGWLRVGAMLNGEPLLNVWVGISAETQKWADIRIPALLDTPAATRFVSAEPLLGPLDLQSYLRPVAGTARPKLDWLIAGGESGPDARVMSLDWVRSLRDQCVAAEVAFHYKQQGTHGGTPKSERTLDGRTWDEFPPVHSRPPTGFGAR